MTEAQFPVLTYQVKYPDCQRTARMAFPDVSSLRASLGFMRRSDHYEPTKVEYLTPWELEREGLTVSRMEREPSPEGVKKTFSGDL